MLVIHSKDYSQVATIGKTHGLEGALNLQLSDQFPNSADNLDFLFILREGHLVPYPLQSLEFKTNDLALAELGFIDNKDQARELLGEAVFLPINQLNTQEQSLSLASLVGFSLFTEQNIPLGNIDDLIEIPNNPLFQIEYQGKEILIPANESLFLEIDEETKVLRMQLPAGLLDLYLNDENQDEFDKPE